VLAARATFTFGKPLKPPIPAFIVWGETKTTFQTFIFFSYKKDNQVYIEIDNQVFIIL